MIELFTVAPADDDAFLAAWEAEAHHGTRLYRALRPDASHRFASVMDGPPTGVVLITTGAADGLEGRQGFLGARTHGALTAIHWSSPLMYARTGVKLPGAMYSPL